MIQRFSDEARMAVLQAKEAAVSLGSSVIGVDHVLYACSLTRDSSAAVPLASCSVTEAAIRARLTVEDDEPSVPIDPEALRAIGIDYEGVRAAVEETFGPGALEAAPDRRAASVVNPKPPFTPDARRGFELALQVATELHHDQIATGDLLLGLLRLDDPFVVSTLTDCGTSVAGVSAAVFAHLAGAG